jgi:hypothetical protein
MYVRFLVVLSLVVAFSAYMFDNRAAMAKCMEKHSRDTCTYSLSR